MVLVGLVDAPGPNHKTPPDEPIWCDYLRQVPRIGEMVMFEGVMFRVREVIWSLDDEEAADGVSVMLCADRE